MVDNLSDALIMAGAVLIFIVALTVCMSSFTNMRTQVDEIVQRNTRIEFAKDEATGEYINYMTADSDIRIVGPETVISSLYRVEKENYKVYINMKGMPSGIDKKTFSSEYKNVIITDPGWKTIEISINGINSDIDNLLNKKGLYKALTSTRKNFKEYLGVYQEKSEASSANKPTYRVITYVESLE